MGSRTTFEEEYVDYKGLAQLLGIKYGTARNWKSKGYIQFTRLNGKIFFPLKPILKKLRANMTIDVEGLGEKLVNEKLSA